jgi:hypothetical protein
MRLIIVRHGESEWNRIGRYQGQQDAPLSDLGARQAEALATYRRARVLLADELGIDPSPDLQRLERRILQQDSTLELRGIPLRGYELIESVGEGRFGASNVLLQDFVSIGHILDLVRNKGMPKVKG